MYAKGVDSVMTRTDRLKINKSERLTAIKNDLRNMLREHHTLASRKLEQVATEMYVKSQALVPVGHIGNVISGTSAAVGTLRDSIDIHVSYSPRYPGIIAVATAKNPLTGYDYALVQEQNEQYKHRKGARAHYLAQPFEQGVEKFFREMGYDK